MFRFENGDAWYGLVAVLLLVLVYRYGEYAVSARLSRFGSVDAKKKLSSGGEKGKGKYIFLGIGLFFLNKRNKIKNATYCCELIHYIQFVGAEIF